MSSFWIIEGVILFAAIAAGAIAVREVTTVHRLTQPVDSPLSGLWLELLTFRPVGSNQQARAHIQRYRRFVFAAIGLVILAVFAMFFAPASGQG